jgi:hypothetical protein
MTPNPKIQELIKSMGIIPEGEHYEIAERIIQECIQVCKSRVGNSDYNTGRMHCVSDLKEHFGVEE